MVPRGANNFILEDEESQLERMFIEEYLRNHGHTLQSLHRLAEAAAKRIRAEACTYAALKLTEVRDRAQFVHEIHGATAHI